VLVAGIILIIVLMLLKDRRRTNETTLDSRENSVFVLPLLPMTKQLFGIPGSDDGTSQLRQTDVVHGEHDRHWVRFDPSAHTGESMSLEYRILCVEYGN
jgi:hypothetical protein